MNLFEGVTLLVVVGLALCSAVHSQSCDVRECPPRRMCVEEEVCRVNRKGREICRTSIRCEIVQGPRPQSDCSLVQCANDKVCRERQTRSGIKAKCHHPATCDNIVCSEGHICQVRLRHRDRVPIARCIAVGRPQPPSPKPTPSPPGLRPSPSTNPIGSTAGPSPSPSPSPTPQDCSEIECREGLQCMVQGNRVMCGRLPQPESCDDLDCEPGYECLENEAEVLCVELTEEPTSIRRVCMGHSIGNFAPGGTIRAVLDELHARFTNCTHVVGNIQIDLSSGEQNPPTLSEDDFSFLRSVEYISGVLRFQHIPAVPRITLPNLQIIRGEESVSTSRGHELVLIINNVEIGALLLPELREISRGDVLFQNSGDLCNYKTVNWLDILSDGELVEQNACNALPGDLLNCSACDSGNCWSNDPLYCQTLSKTVCPLCGLDRCHRVEPDGSLQCCNAQCAAGCFGPGPDECFACKHFENDGTCVSQCPPETIFDLEVLDFIPNPNHRLAAGNICVKECPEGAFEVAGSCLLHCPPNHLSSEGQCIPCDGPCPVECGGLSEHEIVDSETIERFRGCNIVVSGGINIGTVTGFSHEELELLSTIREIRGPLRIQGWDGRSFPYLRNLQRIGHENGSKINLPCGGVSSDFTLLIAFNFNLRELDFSSLEEIRGAGLVLFNNPQLCYAGNFSNYLADPSATQCISTARNDPEICAIEGYTCHEQCSSPHNCWGASNRHCETCRNFRYQDRCVENCTTVTAISSISGYYQNDDSQECEECDQECLGGCTGGVGPEHCVSCRNFILEIPLENSTSRRICIANCPVEVPFTGTCTPAPGMQQNL